MKTAALLLLASAALLPAQNGSQAPLAPGGAGGPGGRAGSLIQLYDFGSGDIAYFAIPQTPPKGGVVVLHDKWGLTDAVKAAVDRLAEGGYIAVAPDLLNGQFPADAARADAAARDLPRDSALRTVAATVRFLRESPRFRASRVALAGWGMGAGLAWEAAIPGKNKVWVSGAAAVGMPAGVDWNDAARTPVPLLGLFDPAFPGTARADLDAVLAGKRNVELHDLPAGLPPDRTWPLLTAFLDRALGGPGPSESLFDRMNPFKPDKDKGDAPAPPPVPLPPPPVGRDPSRPQGPSAE